MIDVKLEPQLVRRDGVFLGRGLVGARSWLTNSHQVKQRWLGTFVETMALAAPDGSGGVAGLGIGLLGDLGMSAALVYRLVVTTQEVRHDVSLDFGMVLLDAWDLL